MLFCIKLSKCSIGDRSLDVPSALTKSLFIYLLRPEGLSGDVPIKAAAFKSLSVNLSNLLFQSTGLTAFFSLFLYLTEMFLHLLATHH